MSSAQPAATPVAIVGMGCLFPKARNTQEFWRLLRTGADGISEVPPTHWRAKDYFDPDPKAPDMTYCTRGGFLSPVPFDPTEFGIPPAILEATDTTQLLSLVAAKAALEDAGYGDQREFDRERVNVIIGVTGTQELVLPLSARLGHPIWRRALAESGVDAATSEQVVRRIADGYVPWQENSFPGLLGNVVAGRIANRLNLRGTNCVVDAACASSLSAVHLAMLELETGRCDLSVAGGADTLNDIFMYMCFSKTPALSPTGDARPFAADADGTVLGEGVGMLVLKRLADAERDGDRIYAVIRGIGTSSDGRSQSIYAPHAAGQSRALRNAYRLAGFGPETVELVEAHGTGTKVGDAIEFESLCDVFGMARRDAGWCALGSVKSQIGHTKAAAGVAGLMKAALAIHHRALPPTIKVSQPNPKLAAEGSPFYLNTNARPWVTRGGRPRRAAVSAFGFGGSNFHAVLESPRAAVAQPAWDGSVQIIALSADDPASLAHKLGDWRRAAAAGELAGDWLAHHAAASRKSFAATAACRLVLVVEAEADLSGLLDSAAVKLAEAGSAVAWQSDYAYYGAAPAPGRLAILFPGQGSQYVGMLGELTCTFPELIDTLTEADHDVANMDARLSDVIHPAPTFSESIRQQRIDRLTRTEAAQPALGAVELGLFRVLSRFGLRPDAVAGHSFGELVALCAAGRFDAPALHRLARLRGRLMSEGDGDRGAMAAIKASDDDVEAVVRDVGGDLVLANRNGPLQCVVSGSREAVAAAVERCRARGLAVAPLRVSGAFHSRLMESAVQPFRNALEAVRLSPGGCAVYANTTGRPYPADAGEARRMLGDQLVRPVDWIGVVRSMYDDGVRTFIEAGPKAVLTGLVRDILGDAPHAAWSVDASGGARGVVDLARVLARAAARGHPVDLCQWERDVSEPRRPKMVVPLCGANYRNARSPVDGDGGAQAGSASAAPRDPVRSPSPPMPDTRPPISRLAPSPAHPRDGVEAGTHVDENRWNHEARVTPMTSDSLEFREAPEPDDRDVRRIAPAGAESAGPPASAGFREPALPPAAPATAAVTEAMRLFQQGLAAMQQLQRDTAEAHRQFLEHQQAAHDALRQVLESQQQLLSVAHDAVALPAPTPTPAARMPEASTHISDVTAPPLHSPPAPSSDIPAPRPALARENALQSPGRAAGAVPAAVVAAPSDVLGAQSKAPAQIAPRPAVEGPPVEAVVVEVVCEKTGYPSDMIQLDMDLEADLGVDSIKRVEIVAALEEKLPHFTGVKPEQMGAIRTLRQIVEFIGPVKLEGSPAITVAASSESRPAVSVGSDASRLAPDAATRRGDASGASPFARTLLTVVSELTGYPLDMLDLTMDLEADLGIDSIKRVEILAAVESRVPSLPTVTPDQMGTLRTLGQIVAHFVGDGAVPAPPDGSEAFDDASVAHSPQGHRTDTEEAAPEPACAADLNRRVLVVRDLPPAQPLGLDLAPGHTLWVTDDGAGLAHAIVERLQRRGLPAALVPLTARPSSADAVAGLIVVAPPLSGAGILWSRESESLARSAFALVKSLADMLPRAAVAGGALVATVSRMDGAFGLAGGSFDAAVGALAGLPKTVAREWEGVLCRAIDVARDWTDAASAAAAVVDELCSEGPIEAGLSPDARRGLELAPTQVIAGQPAVAAGDVVVVSGGARGVTAEAAVALARRYRPTLVLLGRTRLEDEPSWLTELHDEGDIRQAVRQFEFAPGDKPRPADVKRATARYLGLREIRRTLERIEAAGSRAIYCSVDVCNAGAVRQVLDEVVRTHGPVRGLVHGAGLIEDRRIVNKTQEQFDAVFETKVGGLRSLLSAIDVTELRHLVLFSSVSGRCGNVGQIDYAMANEALNKIAQQLSRGLPDCRIASLNWGPWDGGMVHPALREEFRRHGVGLIPLKAGGEAVADELSDASDSAVEIIFGSAFEMSPMSPARRAPGVPLTARKDMHVAFERRLDPAAHAFLASHVIGGQAVLPAAMMIEWLVHAAVHALPGLRVQGVDDFRVLRGVVPGGAAPLLRFYTAPPRRSGDVFDVEAELRSDDGAGGEALHARATVVLSSRLMTAPPFVRPTGLADRPYPAGAEGAYDDALFHGPHFRVLASIDGLSHAGLVAGLRLSAAPADWMTDPLHSDWLTSPAAIDAVFQAAIVWSREELGAPCLPAAVRGYRQYAPLPPDGVTLLLQVRSSAPRRLLADAIYLARDGAVVARMEGCDCTVDAGLAERFRENSAASVAS